LGRIIKYGTPGKDRNWLEKGIIIAIRELSKQTGVNSDTYDLLAFISLSLNAIGATVDESVLAWEKRGYWVKADRYRMEWSWSSRMGDELEQALRNEDWGSVTKIIAQVTQKMSKVNVPAKNRLGNPWVGSWEQLISPNQSH
jgi:hypothetical protein